ncbi:MAG TPA: phospholipase D-like domain-containing protein [Myxococcales bacterium]
MHPSQPPDVSLASLRLLAEQAFSRAAGAPLVAGNRVKLLRDAAENYPAWLEAIERAGSSIVMNSYILADDEIGNRFAAALGAAASRGVRVRILQDWLGARGEASHAFWARLHAFGVEVRWFNPFRFEAPLGWLRRNHRKSFVVDGRIGFVTGLCIAQRWLGNSQHGIPPWRDTGIQIEGPAVADIAHAFEATWSDSGPATAKEAVQARGEIPAEGDISVRVIATEPATAGAYRFDTLVAGLARRTLWLTDAYFVGLPSYVQALRAAAMDGVDVRLLVPGSSDLGIVKRLGTAGFRPLLAGGIRVFEWNGSMLHAKTAVADGRWARVGSTNLNVASWMGNWELDVAIEDDGFAREMEQAYEADLSNATEILLGLPRRRPERRLRAAPGTNRVREGSALATAGVIRVGGTVTAALGGHRLLRPAEAGLLSGASVVLLALAAVALVFPRAVAIPVALVAVWLGITLFIDAVKLRRAGRAKSPPASDPPRIGS